MLFMSTIPTMPCYWALEVLKNLGHFQSFPSAQLHPQIDAWSIGNDSWNLEKSALNGQYPMNDFYQLHPDIHPGLMERRILVQMYSMLPGTKAQLRQTFGITHRKTKDLVKGSNEFIATSCLNRLDVTSESFWTTISGEVTSCRCNFV